MTPDDVLYRISLLLFATVLVGITAGMWWWALWGMTYQIGTALGASAAVALVVSILSFLASNE